MIGLINYGSGNIHAIATIYHRLSIPFELVADAAGMARCDKLILPGVGDFDETMQLFHSLGITQALHEQVLVKQKLIMGVCVGLQVLGEGSEEGNQAGLGWIPGRARRFDESLFTQKPHLPHLGWNSIQPTRETPIFARVDLQRGFYFLHSYYFEARHEEHVLATADYPKAFACAIQRDNIYGMQFHPEKSHDNGLRIFENFAAL